MSKFKVGDIVKVQVEQPFKDLATGELLYPKGEEFEICQRAVDYNSEISQDVYFKESDRMWVVRASDLELAAICKSPLWKALS